MTAAERLEEIVQVTAKHGDGDLVLLGGRRIPLGTIRDLVALLGHVQQAPTDP